MWPTNNNWICCVTTQLLDYLHKMSWAAKNFELIQLFVNGNSTFRSLAVLFGQDHCIYIMRMNSTIHRIQCVVESECFIILTCQSYREFHRWIELMLYTVTLNCRSTHIGTQKMLYNDLYDKLQFICALQDIQVE